MAKAKKQRILNANMRRNFFIAAVVLITLGLLSFFMEYKNQQETELQLNNSNQNTPIKKPKDIGPKHGCEAQPTGYVCSVRINNPSGKELEWSAIIDGIEGASVSQNGAGILAANSWVMIELTVPEKFCLEHPDGKGKVTILDTKQSTNRSEAAFDCNVTAI